MILSIISFMLPSAHVERFSVSYIPDFKKCPPLLQYQGIGKHKACQKLNTNRSLGNKPNFKKEENYAIFCV